VCEMHNWYVCEKTGENEFMGRHEECGACSANKNYHAKNSVVEPLK